MSIEEAKEVLRNAGYYVDNLWHVDDVSDKLDNYIIPEGEELDEYDMQDILDEVLQSEYIIEKINVSIEDELGNLYSEEEE